MDTIQKVLGPFCQVIGHTSLVQPNTGGTGVVPLNVNPWPSAVMYYTQEAGVRAEQSSFGKRENQRDFHLQP
jgi:hypothetical protein